MMDLSVRQIAENTWVLSDLLDRLAGRIEAGDNATFRIVPAGRAVETMRGMATGPFASLDMALAEIERHTRGTCRLETGGAPVAPSHHDDERAEADVIGLTGARREP